MTNATSIQDSGLPYKVDAETPVEPSLCTALTSAFDSCGDDWYTTRIHDITLKLERAQHVTPLDVSPRPHERDSAPQNSVMLSVDDVQWLLQVLQRRDVVVQQVENLWEEWHERQTVSAGELTLTSRLRTALRTSH